MDNFIVESMMFEHQIQCEIDQCFIEMHEYIFDENADIMLEEAQNKQEGIIDKIIRKVREFIQKIKGWFSKLTKNEQVINKKIEKVEEEIKRNPEIGKQQTDNFDTEEFVDKILKRDAETFEENIKYSKKMQKYLYAIAADMVGLGVIGVVGWVKSGKNKRAMRKLQDELDKTNSELEKAKAKSAKDAKTIYDLKRSQERAGERVKNQNNEINDLNKKLKASEDTVNSQKDLITDLNKKAMVLTMAATIVQQEADRQTQVATTGKPVSTSTKHSGENTAPSTNGAPKTREQKNEAERISQEEQAKRRYIKYLDTIVVNVWGNGATRKDVTNLANSVKSENEVLEKLKNINPKPNNPKRIPEMIMVLKRKSSEYNELKNSASRKKS